MEVQLKSAREMFKELGYKCLNDTDYEKIFNKQNKRCVVYGATTEVDIGKSIHSIIIGIDEKDITNFIIYFNNNDESLGIEPYRLKFKELQAINKQIEELGWNE